KQSPELFLARHPDLAGRRVILFLSRLDPIKGLDLLLKGYARTREAIPDAALVIAGNGEDSFLARLQDQAQQLGLQRDVVWAGFLQGEEKRAVFAAADIFVLPSYSENFGIAVVEAMANGLPVIISDQVGIHREVARVGAGLVVRCDADEVQQALVQMLGAQSVRDKMSPNARRLAAEFSPEVVTARLCDTYESCALLGSPVCCSCAVQR